MRLNIFSCELYLLVPTSLMIIPCKYLALSLNHNNSQLTVQPCRHFGAITQLVQNHNISLGIQKSITNSAHKVRGCFSKSELLYQS